MFDILRKTVLLVKIGNMKLKFSIFAVGLIIIAALSRILPHPPNVTPVAAMGIFGAAYFVSKRWAYVIPFLALFISDLVLNNIFLRSFIPDATGLIWFTKISLFVYLGFGLTIWLSKILLKNINTSNIIKATLLASLIFYVVSNLGVWLTMPNTTMSIVGLFEVYIAGLPYLLNSILGNFFFVAVFFGIAEYVRSKEFRFITQDTQL